MNLQTLKKWSVLTRLVRNPIDFVLEEHSRKTSPWMLRFRDGMEMELRPGRGDCDAFRESFLQRDYLGPGQSIRPGDTVVDIGANIGCFTIFAARAVGPNGRVIAVEPAGETFAQLQRNIALTKLTNVTLVQAAVAGQPGEVTLTTSDNSLFASMFSRIDGRQNSGRSEQVDAITLDQLLRRCDVTQVNFLKLDCEGAEHGIIEQAEHDTFHSVRQIAMEIHDVDGVSNDALIDRLRGFGYSMRRASVLLYFTIATVPSSLVA